MRRALWDAAILTVIVLGVMAFVNAPIAIWRACGGTFPSTEHAQQGEF